MRKTAFNPLFILFILGALLSAISSCKKDVIIPTVKNDTIYDYSEQVSDTPKIAFVSISPGVVTEYQDSIVIVISYIDGGGDLGENQANAKNLFVTDPRNNITYNYRIPQLAPTGSNINVQGKFSILISSTAITDNSTSQTFQYSIYIQDRAGHTSNVISTSDLKVVK